VTGSAAVPAGEDGWVRDVSYSQDVAKLPDAADPDGLHRVARSESSTAAALWIVNTAEVRARLVFGRGPWHRAGQPRSADCGAPTAGSAADCPAPVGQWAGDHRPGAPSHPVPAAQPLADT